MSTEIAVLSPTQYLQDERNRDEKYEYESGKLELLAGNSRIHNRLTGNLLASLWSHFKQVTRSFEVYASNLRVHTPKTGFYYPDLVITKGKEQYLDKEFDTLLNPLILIEVLSDQTEARDRGIKFEAYRSIEALQEYLLVSQKDYIVEGSFKNEDGEWIIQDPIRGLESTYQFKSIDFKLSLKDIYQNVPLKS